MRRYDSPPTHVGRAFVLFTILLFAVTAAAQIGIKPASVGFGSVPIGSSASQTVTLNNPGNENLTISQASVSGAGFAISGLTIPLTLEPGQTVSFTTTFTPQSSGTDHGRITLGFSRSYGRGRFSSGTIISLTGTGTAAGQLGAAPTSVSFASVQVGSSQAQSASLTNSGSSSLTVSQAALSGTAFSMGGLSLPLTLAAGQSTSFTVTFAPTASGSASGSVTITSNGSNPSLSIPLSGTGVSQGTLSPNPASLAFGSVQDNKTSNLSETLTNSGGSSLTISAASASGTGFSMSGLSLPLTLAAGQSTSFTVTFAPTASGSATGSVTITSNGSNPSLSIPLSGTGVAQGALTANPTSLAFANTQVGSSTNLSETLTNTGGSSVTVSQATSNNDVFSISGLTLPLTLTANQSVTFTATFTPTSAAAATGTLSVVSTASNSTLSIALSGTGTALGTLAVTPASLIFGNVTVGSNSALSGSLTASGASVTITAASSNNSEFALSGISLPVTLASGQSTAFTVTFTPQAAGATSASLSFASNASNSPTVQSMTGTGVAAAQHSVDLSWDSTADAVGYNVYRSTVSGGPYTMINSSLDGTTTYTDSTVVSGQTYYYVATSVNSQSQESSYSNQTEAVIPNP